MNRKLATILAGLSTVAAFAVNGSTGFRRFRERRQNFAPARCLSFWYRCCCTNDGKQYGNVSADDCIWR
ncbi:MAG: hypothetical protein ACLS69_00975 [Butyricicoccus sp.]